MKKTREVQHPSVWCRVLHWWWHYDIPLTSGDIFAARKICIRCYAEWFRHPQCPVAMDEEEPKMNDAQIGGSRLARGHAVADTGSRLQRLLKEYVSDPTEREILLSALFDYQEALKAHYLES